MYLKMSKGEVESGLTTGRYQIIINPWFINPAQARQWLVDTINNHSPIAKTWSGKSFVINRAFMENGHIGIEVEILQNPIPIIAILVGAGFLVGGFLIWQIVVEVRKLFTINDIGDIGKIAIPFLVVVGGVILARKFL